MTPSSYEYWRCQPLFSGPPSSAQPAAHVPSLLPQSCFSSWPWYGEDTKLPSYNFRNSPRISTFPLTMLPSSLIATRSCCMVSRSRMVTLSSVRESWSTVMQ